MVTFRGDFFRKKSVNIVFFWSGGNTPFIGCILLLYIISDVLFDFNSNGRNFSSLEPHSAEKKIIFVFLRKNFIK